MKVKFTLFILLMGLTLIVASRAFCQTPPNSASDSTQTTGQKNVLKTNLLGLVSVLYEVQVKPKRSLQFSVNRINFGFLGDEDKIFMLTGAYKFYLTNKEPEASRSSLRGFYVSPYLRYSHVYNTITPLFSSTVSSEVVYNLLGGGVVAGYQAISKKGFSLDLFGGLGYLPIKGYQVKYVNTDYVQEYHPEGYAPDLRLGICLGYAF